MYNYLVLGHKEAYFVREHSDSKNKFSEDDDHQIARVSGRKPFRGFLQEGFPADSRNSNGNQLCPSSSRHISLLI